MEAEEHLNDKGLDAFKCPDAPEVRNQIIGLCLLYFSICGRSFDLEVLSNIFQLSNNLTDSNLEIVYNHILKSEPVYQKAKLQHMLKLPSILFTDELVARFNEQVASLLAEPADKNASLLYELLSFCSRENFSSDFIIKSLVNNFDVIYGHNKNAFNLLLELDTLPSPFINVLAPFVHDYLEKYSHKKKSMLVFLFHFFNHAANERSAPQLGPLAKKFKEKANEIVVQDNFFGFFKYNPLLKLRYFQSFDDVIDGENDYPLKVPSLVFQDLSIKNFTLVSDEPLTVFHSQKLNLKGDPNFRYYILRNFFFETVASQNETIKADQEVLDIYSQVLNIVLRKNEFIRTLRVYEVTKHIPIINMSSPQERTLHVL